MQHKSQEKRRTISKPPAAGGGLQMRINGTVQKSAKGGSSLFSSAKDHAKGLATVLYGIQDSCGSLFPGDKLRRQQMMKEILIRRVLLPPPRRFNLRWRNFHPKPSRLSMMSTA